MSQRSARQASLSRSVALRLALISLAAGCDQLGAEAYVSCAGGLPGVTCSVTRRAGVAEASACWEVRFTCSNGVKSSARACHPVPDGREAMSSRLIPWRDFKDFDECDVVATTSVENLAVTLK
jgi:hypothetical protein